MSKIGDAIGDFRGIDSASRKESLLRRLHPLVKLLFTIFFLIILLSRGRYDVRGLIFLAIYPLVIMIVGGLSFSTAVKRLRVIIPLICLMGILEPIFNRTPIYIAEGIAVPAGVMTGLTLIMKGLLAVFSAYILMATTPIEEICYALRLIHVPKIIVTVILLIYRYIGILLSEGRRVISAYELRAPGQRGVARKAWGSLAGQMLLRSMDRAESLYQSMQLRGFDGEFYIGKSNRHKG